jgi:hypothetical protein
MVWRAIKGLGDAGALPQLAAKLHVVPLSGATQAALICEAAGVAGAPSPAWEAFREAAQPWTALAAEAQAVLADVSRCD